jgi:hypothetical protein
LILKIEKKKLRSNLDKDDDEEEGVQKDMDIFH